jgi:hypothetical protein
MAKASGLGMTALSVEDSTPTLRDIRNDITNLQWATPRAVQDITGVDKFAYERLLLLADMSMTLNAVYDNAANKVHDVFKSVPTYMLGRAFTLTVNGTTLGTTPTVQLIATDYAITRAQTGELTASIPLSLSNGAIPTWT